MCDMLQLVADDLAEVYSYGDKLKESEVAEPYRSRY